MRLNLDIETHDRRLGFDIAGVDGTLTSGTWVEVPGSAKLQFCGAIIRKAVNIPEILQFALDTTKDIEIGLFAAWLYDKVKGKDVERIVVNRRVVTEITENCIRQVLEEEIRSIE
jgi:hypothetical protein